MLRSTSLRLALACAAAVLVASLAALAVVWLYAGSFERRTFQDAVAADVQELGTVFANAGPIALVRAVDARAASDAIMTMRTRTRKMSVSGVMLISAKMPPSSPGSPSSPPISPGHSTARRKPSG